MTLESAISDRIKILPLKWLVGNCNKKQIVLAGILSCREVAQEFWHGRDKGLVHRGPACSDAVVKYTHILPRCHWVWVSVFWERQEWTWSLLFLWVSFRTYSDVFKTRHGSRWDGAGAQRRGTQEFFPGVHGNYSDDKNTLGIAIHTILKNKSEGSVKECLYLLCFCCRRLWPLLNYCFNC